MEKNPSTHSLDFARLLIDSGANVNAVDCRGLTPLLICCSSGRADLLELLVQRGADIRVKDSNGNGAVEVATFYGQNEVLSLLEKLTKK